MAVNHKPVVRWTITILGDASEDPEKLARMLRRVARVATVKARDMGLGVDGAVTGRNPAIAVHELSETESARKPR